MSETRTIFEVQFFDGRDLLSVGVFQNSSIWIKSDFFKKPVTLNSKALKLTDAWEFRLRSNDSSESSVFEIVQEKLAFRFFFLNFVETFPQKRKKSEITKSSGPLNGLEDIDDKKIRIFKFDRETEIKNFFLSGGESKQITVILPDLSETHPPYALLEDGSKLALSIRASSSYESISEYTIYSKCAVVKDQPHIFGGYSDSKRVI